jgi:hypothetical protein
MSSIWTPSGERPVGRPPEPPPAPPGPGRPSGPPGGPGGPGAAGAGGGRQPTEEEIQAELAEISRQVLETPASIVIANHCVGLFQLAALHLNQRPPNLDEAKLAVDAMGAVVEGLGSRLGDEEQPLRDALTQIRLAWVQVRNAGPQG